ncbi:MAG: InlB B-repeat-containing protein [Clostridia bacterium]|nr:InlB B-repeat-containing protein [Clostridia bacterium]
MKKSFQKLISVVLVALMLVTPLSSGIFALAATIAVNALGDVVIAVPETVYLTPSADRATKGQYYVNNTINKTTHALETEASPSNTNAYVQFYIPGATDVKIAVNTMTTGIGDVVLTGAGATSGSYENISYAELINNGYFEYKTAGLYISGTGLAAGQTALAEWVFTVTMSDGSTRTYYAYSVLYAPNYHSVGVHTEAYAGGSNNIGISGWISGIHSSAGVVQSTLGNDTGSMDAEGVFINEPLLNLSSVKVGSISSATDVISDNADNLYARGYWRDDDGEDSRTKSYLGVLTVDGSRYSNLNQIPNLYVGADVNHLSSTIEKDQHFYSWYELASGAQHTGAGDNSAPDSTATKFVDLYNSGGSYSATLVAKFSNLASIQDFYGGIKNNGGYARLYTSPNLSISGLSAGTVRYIHAWTQAKKCKRNGTDVYDWVSGETFANAFTAVQVTITDKNSLRQAVANCAGFSKENYTTESWNTYVTALREAATNLGNPTSTNVSTTALENARKELKTPVNIQLNGGTLSTATPAYLSIGANSSVKISEQVSAPTRAGHTFLGWARSSSATTGDKNLQVGFNETVYAIWQANDYALLYDNLFNIVEFSKSAGMTANTTNAYVEYNKNEKSITVVTNSAEQKDKDGNPITDATTNVGLGGNYYNVAVQSSTEYIFEYDVVTDVRAQVHLFFYDKDSGTTWLMPSDRSYTYTRTDGSVENGTYADGGNSNFMWRYTDAADSGHYVLKFKTPANADTMSFRFGNCNVSDVTSTFSNIRLIDAANYYEDVEYTETAKVYTYADGAKYGTLFAPVRTAYNFSGWFTGPDGNGENINKDTVNADKSTVLYSKWTPITYTITFNTDGGANVPSLTYTYEDINRALPVSNKAGYAFDGWKVEKADGNWDTNKTYFAIDKNYGNVTLKANFVDPGYQINLSIAEDEIYSGSVTYNYNYFNDFLFDESMLPTKNGHRFTGWEVIGKSAGATWNIGTQYKLIDGKVTIPKGNEGSVTLKPMWEMVNYTINYNTDGGNSIAPTSYNIITPVTLPTPTKAGYKFTGWTVSSVSGNWTESYTANQVLTGMYGNVTLKANWDANGYVVTFNPNGGEVNPTSISYDITKSISIPTPTRTGYTFNNWKVEAAVGNWSGTVGGGELLREKHGNVTLVAQWTPISYTIIYDTQGEAISPTPYTIETELNIPASVRNGFTFTGWTVKTPDGNWTQDGTINAGKLSAGKYGNVTLTANFTENTYTVTFNDDSTANISYKITESITIPELVKAGYTFKGWEVKDSSGSWTKGTIINYGNLSNGRYGDVTLDPVFTANNYKITFVPDGGIMDSDTLAYTPDDITTLPTPVKTGFNFMGWKVTAPAGSWIADAVIADGTSLEGKYGDVTLTAVWEAKTFTITWVDGDGKVIDTDTVAYGETPEYEGTTPAKTATAEFSYTFNNTWSPAIVAVTEDATYVAQFDATVNTYTVTWKYQATESDEYTTVESTFKYGEYPVFNNGAIPERKSDNEEDHVYRFVRWVKENSTDGIGIVEGDVTYIAEFTEVKNPETVTWIVNGQSYETKWAIGDTPSFPGSTILPDSNGAKHEITGWTPEISAVIDGGATYTAVITSTPKDYKVNFILNGGSGDLTEYSYNKETQAFPWIITNKPGYDFAGWKLVKVDSTESFGWNLDETYDDISNVLGNWGNVTFEAQWEPADYTITIFSTGAEINYNIESAGKLSADPKDGYVLSGWIIVSTSGISNWREGDIVAADKVLTGMYGNVTVEPMWSAKPYKLTLISGLNGEEERVIEIKYGDILDEYYPVAISGYTAKWDGELPEIMPANDITLTAEYKTIQYFLNFDVAGGNEEKGFYYDITSDKTLPVPTHEGAQFDHWVVADGNGSWYKGMAVSKNEVLKGHYGSATLTAQWTLNRYTVTWDIDGTKKLTQWYYGAIPAFDGTPYKAPDADNSYEFVGWDKEITEVTGDVTYTAQFEPVERTYTVKWKIENYTVEENYKWGETPVYKGEIPTKPATNEYEFIFTGWSPEIEAVDRDITYTAQFQTNVKLLGIRIDKTSLFMNVGEEDVLRAILSPATATNKDIIWSSSDESVVTIDENGKVTAVGAGIAIICVQSANGNVRAYSVISVSPVINQYVIVSAGGLSTTRLSGQSIQLTATLMPDNEVIKNVTWTSSNPEVAVVESSGLVIYGLVPGTAVITATVDGYIAGSIEVTTTDNSGDIVDRVKTYIVSFNASTSQYIIGDNVYDNISIVYAEGDTVEFLLTEPHFAMANGVQLERDTDGVFRIENIQQHYVISTVTRADIGFEDDSEEEEPKLSFFDKLKAFFQTIIDFFRNLFR